MSTKPGSWAAIEVPPKRTCGEYRALAAMRCKSVWAIREEDRQIRHRTEKAAGLWKPVPRNERGFLIRREKINGQWTERLEYPGKTAVRRALIQNMSKGSDPTDVTPTRNGKRR